jgi:hypothetical protein
MIEPKTPKYRDYERETVIGLFPANFAATNWNAKSRKTTVLSYGKGHRDYSACPVLARSSAVAQAVRGSLASILRTDIFRF